MAEDVLWTVRYRKAVAGGCQSEFMARDYEEAAEISKKWCMIMGHKWTSVGPSAEIDRRILSPGITNKEQWEAVRNGSVVEPTTSVEVTLDPVIPVGSSVASKVSKFFQGAP